jgi:hypothetical protein
LRLDLSKNLLSLELDLMILHTGDVLFNVTKVLRGIFDQRLGQAGLHGLSLVQRLVISLVNIDSQAPLLVRWNPV